MNQTSIPQGEALQRSPRLLPWELYPDTYPGDWRNRRLPRRGGRCLSAVALVRGKHLPRPGPEDE